MLEVLTRLRDAAEFRFELMMDLCGWITPPTAVMFPRGAHISDLTTRRMPLILPLCGGLSSAFADP